MSLFYKQHNVKRYCERYKSKHKSEKKIHLRTAILLFIEIGIVSIIRTQQSSTLDLLKKYGR